MASGPDRVGTRRYRVLIISSLRYPIIEPFAGGLEAHTDGLASGLRSRGHSVSVAGAVGSDPAIVAHEFGRLPAPRPGERADTMENDEVRIAERAGFAQLFDDLRAGRLGEFDIVHNNSLYPLPVEQAATLACPLITTLHTPPLPWSERVLGQGRQRAADFVAVSESTAASWWPLLRPRVVLNGIDTEVWPLGPGGTDAVWSGRIVSEKAPHLAADIARAAGLGLTIAGPIVDPRYYRTELLPRLDDRIRYVGHLDRAALATLVGASAVALVTPTWAEPFGMVVAEAMSCGTPVVAFARGGIPEILVPSAGRLLPPPGDTVMSGTELATAAHAVHEAMRLDRASVRARAVTSLDRSVMVRGYECVYRDARAAFTGRP